MSGSEMGATWELLSITRPTGQTLWARVALPMVTDRLLACTDASGARYFVTALDDANDAITDERSRGISVQTLSYFLPQLGAGRFVVIKCIDRAGEAAFDLMGSDLARALAEGELVTEAVTRAIGKWRRFWSQVPSVGLTHSGQVGLFGELWFLAVWLQPSIGWESALRRWRGPFDSRHDFEWPGASVEVKTTTLVNGPIHTINGLDQLVPPENGALWLFSLSLRQEGGATNTLPVLVQSCRAALRENGLLSDTFEERLIRAKYFDAHAAEYQQHAWRVTSEQLYAVRDDFPRVTQESLRAPLPSSISNVAYEVSLSGYEDLCVAKSPETAASLWA